MAAVETWSSWEGHPFPSLTAAAAAAVLLFLPLTETFLQKQKQKQQQCPCPFLPEEVAAELTLVQHLRAPRLSSGR